MKEIKIQGNDVDLLIEIVKSFKDTKTDGLSHDVDVNGYHIYLFEGTKECGGILHINKK